jgi:hypothetical protein
MERKGVFSLKRKLDELGRARQERRFAEQAGRRRIEAVQHVFGISLERLQDVFSAPVEDERLPAYPLVIYLGDQGVKAFLHTQTIEMDQYPRYLHIIREGREEVTFHHYERDGLHTFVAQHEEMSGKNIRLLTNDAELLRKLARSGFNPPCPWVAFYELGPFVSATQGNAEYWFNNIWQPFWESLSLDEQSAFLEKKRPESSSYMSEQEWSDWVDGIRLRDARYRDLEG